MSNIAIKVDNISKTFKLPHERHTSLKNAFVSIFNAIGKKKTYDDQEVLRNISLDIKKGEFFGVVGRNGSGKSTLLKLLAGIYSPDSGEIKINGKLTPFIELGVGFSPELTGRENVFLNGSLLGFTRKEMEGIYDEIVDFAELEDHMDVKLKNFSSGMQVRLAFAVAIRAETEVLLIDEVLAVGDAVFQQKCYDYFDKLKESDKTVVFISHDLGAVQTFCDRAALIHDGDLLKVGTPEEVVHRYSELLSNETRLTKKIESTNLQHIGAGGAEILKGELLNKQNKVVKGVNEGEPFTIRIHYKTDQKIEDSVIGIGIMGEKGSSILGPNSRESNIQIKHLKERGYIDAVFPKTPLSAGRYRVRAGIFNISVTIPYDFIENLLTLHIIGKKRHGEIHIEPEWRIN